MKWQPFFDHASQVFEKIGSGCAPFEASIAGRNVRFLFANDPFRQFLTPAIQHLSIEQSIPDLTIYLWDDASTGTRMIPPPWDHSAYLPKGDVAGWSSERFTVTYQQANQVLLILDRETKTALYWTSDYTKLPQWERGAPLLSLFQFWLRSETTAILHGAALGIEEGGVLLAGRGGSGKSTTAIAALRSPLFYAADDYCAVRFDKEPRIYSLYNTAKAYPQTLKQLGISHPSSGQPKELLFLYPEHRNKLKTSFRLKSICVPQIREGTESKLIPCSSATALAALAPSSIFQLPASGEGAFRTMASLVNRVPSYVLQLGTRLESAPQAILGHLLEAVLKPGGN